MGLAKLRSYPIPSVKTAHFFSRNRLILTAQSRKFLACAASANSRIVCSSNQPKRRFCRRLTVASAATSAAETEDSGVITKIPPDNRIPATIITGFLGSGKVFSVFPINLCVLMFCYWPTFVFLSVSRLCFSSFRKLNLMRTCVCHNFIMYVRG